MSPSSGKGDTDMAKCYIGLGSNLGSRGQTMRAALREIARMDGVRLLAVSHFYETRPWGKTDQPPFLNGAALIDIEISAEDLLMRCHAIEAKFGRKRMAGGEHWGPRTIDIDLLFMPGICRSSAPILPHPYMKVRAFVLVPLLDLSPELKVGGTSIQSLLAALPKEEVEGVKRSAELSDPYPISLIACMDKNRGLGHEGELLANNSEDMRHFRALTLGGIVIMGRRTQESLPGGHPLKGRINIVLSQTKRKIEGFRVCKDEEELFAVLGELAEERREAKLPPQKIWCIGGASLYRMLLPYIAEAYLTELTGDYDADVFLPELTEFTAISTKHGKNLRYCYLVRKESAFLGNLS